MNFTCKKFYKNIMKFPIPVGISCVIFVYLCVETDVCVHSGARRGCLVFCSIIPWLLPPETGSSGPLDFCTQCWAASFLPGPEDLNLGLNVCTSSPLLTGNVNLMSLFERIQCCEVWKTYHLAKCVMNGWRDRQTATEVLRSPGCPGTPKQSSYLRLPRL